MSDRDVSSRLRRAVKENNLGLVKRLIQRTDLRNPDPGPQRYTSLAWAAVLGHEETFEYLLSMGHDDEELSKDAENNTILILLAGLGGSSNSTPYRTVITNNDHQSAAMRMARLYWERFPFITDWSNVHGKTALHVAALKGSESFVNFIIDLGADVDLADSQGNTPLHYASAWGHIPVVQSLIEKGCAFNAKNNEGFTASDYAYSNTTQEALQKTAHNQFETNKMSRKQAATRNLDYDMDYGTSRYNVSSADIPRRYRSNSITSGSDSFSTDFENIQPSRVVHGSSSSSQLSAQSSSGSVPRNLSPPILGSAQPRTESRARLRSNPSATQPPIQSHSSRPSLGATSSASSGGGNRGHSREAGSFSSSISPYATRTLERDKDAMENYMRTRSGSNSSTAETPSMRTTLTTRGGQLPSELWQQYQSAQEQNGQRPDPRLRTSNSATSLRSIGTNSDWGSFRTPQGTLNGNGDSRNNVRVRAGTLDTILQGKASSNTTPSASPISPMPGNRRAPASNGNSSNSRPPDPNSQHGRRPSGSLLKEMASLRVE